MMLFDLSGRVALVTGGNGGIGLGIAKGLAQAGAKLVIAGRNAEKNAAAHAELAALGEAHVIAVDVTNEAACRAMVAESAERFGGLDILVNNAGVSRGGGRPESIAMDSWRAVLDANLDAVFIASQAAFPLMKARGGGKIINIGSMYSLFGAGFIPAYSASKGAVVQLTKSLAVAWAPDNIQVNVILPGWIETEMTAGAVASPAFSEAIVRRTPAGRWGQPDEFAGPGVFLASKASDFVTGAVLTVDGGFAVQG